MFPTASQDTDRQRGGDPRKIASRKMLGLGGGLDPADDSLALWAGRYMDLAVTGARSAEVAGKIARHVGRFHTWFVEGFGHDRISAVTPREVTAWRDHLAAAGQTDRDGIAAAMAPATVNNHLAHLSAMFTWTRAHAPDRLLPHGDPTKGVEPLRLPAPETRALNDAQVRTVKNVLDRIEGFHRLTGRAHRTEGTTPAVHRHARPLRDRAIAHLMLGTGLRRAEVVGLVVAQLDPADPAELRRVKRARLAGVRGKGALSPRSINTIIGEIGRLHDLQVDDPERQLGTLRPRDLRHSFAYRLSAASGHNRAELERRLGHANDRYLRLYTNPPDEIAAGFVEHL